MLRPDDFPALRDAVHPIPGWKGRLCTIRNPDMIRYRRLEAQGYVKIEPMPFAAALITATDKGREECK